MEKFKIKQMLYKIDMKSREFSILLYLLDRCDKDYTCFPSIKTISSELKISVSTTKRGLISLCENGYIEKIERFSDISGRQTSNLYIINILKIEEEYNIKNTNEISKDDFLNEIENEMLKENINFKEKDTLYDNKNPYKGSFYFNTNKMKNNEKILSG
ncbi:MAG: helix-turn-helix domain-containing protein [Lachnospirales bacterium]